MSGSAQDRLKQQAAAQAVGLLRSGMVVGLGSGTTAAFAVQRVGELLRRGELRDLVGVPTSAATEALARELQIPLAPADAPPPIDLTIDGADEVDPQLDLIKGHGGALLREKIVAQLSRRVVIIVDEGKLSPRLGTLSRLPVEAIPFAWRTQLSFLEACGAKPELRLLASGEPYRTDQGNFVLDCPFAMLGDPTALAARLAARAGIVEHGLFLGLATDVVVAGEQGIRHLTRPVPREERP
jgi:ribose 5-phosphate isomerase A